MCKIGYSLNMNTFKCEQSDIQIKNCVWQANHEIKGNICYSCLNGAPSQDFKSCLPFGSFPGKDHCVAGMKTRDGLTACHWCEKGYVNQGGSGCHKEGPGYGGEGCGQIMGRKQANCLVCAVWNGYASTEPFECEEIEE